MLVIEVLVIMMLNRTNGMRYVESPISTNCLLIITSLMGKGGILYWKVVEGGIEYY